MCCHPVHKLTWTLSIGCIAVSCAPQANSGSPRAPASDTRKIVSEWLPLEDNSVLEFDTSVEGTGEKGRLVMQVQRSHGNHVVLGVAGKMRRLEVTPEGVSIATGGWLLKQPLTVGSSFQGLSGRVTVINADCAVAVPAGQFTHCIETEEKTSTTTTRTDFCRGIGITRLVIEGQVNGELRREVAELRFHGPRIDLGPEKTTAAPAGE
jgi:hypothetical protein